MSKLTEKNPLFIKTPPYDTEAEAALLSAIFINNENILETAEILGADDFYKGAHKKIFKAIMDLFEKDEPADLVTVANRLKEMDALDSAGGAAFLAAISDSAPMAVNAVHYAEIIKGKSILRQLINTTCQIMEKSLNESGNYKEVLDFAQSSILKTCETKSNRTFSKLDKLVGLNIDTLEEQQGKAGSLIGLTTGYRFINKITSGLQKSDLIIIAARPSMGKTAFALNIARNVALEENAPVAVYSLEMSKEQLSMRLLTSEARINSSRLRTGVMSQDEWVNISDAAGVLCDLPIFIDDTPNISAMEVKSKTRKLKNKHGLGLVIIDYLQLMAPSSQIKKANRRDLEIAEISSALKGLAKELNIPVIALSQLNRMLEQRSDKRPMLSDLRESGSLEQDADIVAFIYRDEVYNKEPDNPKKGTAEIIIAKNRNGATGTAHMSFLGQYTRFEDLIQQPEIFQ